MKADFMFTSESLTEGHPDKLCDQISDALVDRFLQQDSFASVIAECAVSTGIVFVAARFDSEAIIDVPNTARRVIQQVGYDQPDFNARTCSVMTSLNELPPRPERGRDERHMSETELDAVPARNQVTAFGFACMQSAALMPLPIWLAHQLARQLSRVRREGELDYLGPDGKTQVSVEYRQRRPCRLHSIVLIASPRHGESLRTRGLREEFLTHIVEPAFAHENLKPDARTRILINPEDALTVGGPSVHPGLTGRKTAVDSYGEYARHSGAALSGKDPGRIDRVGVYAARYAAKNVVAAGLAEECEVQLSYSAGFSRPVSIQVETFGTGKISDEDIAARLEAHFDFRPAGIIRAFELRFLPVRYKDGFYRKLAAYGQVGRMDLEVPWERIDKVPFLQ